MIKMTASYHVRDDASDKQAWIEYDDRKPLSTWFVYGDVSTNVAAMNYDSSDAAISMIFGDWEADPTLLDVAR